MKKDKIRSRNPEAAKKTDKQTAKKDRLRRALFWFVFASILLSLASAVVSIVFAPADVDPADPDAAVKSDYTLMVFQGVCGIVALFLPSLLERRANFRISNFIYVFYIIFLYCAIYLGEMSNFFYRFAHWDTLLHITSGALIGAVGFSVVDILNRNSRAKVNLSPVFVAVFAFGFALSTGAVWEIFEYCADGLLGVNMQKFMLEDGTLLTGRDALRDTMGDIIVDAAGALFMCVMGYIGLKTGKGDVAEGITLQKTALPENTDSN